jgi:hypothetical protein
VAKVDGLVVIGVSLALVVLASRVANRWMRLIFAVAAGAIWLLSLFAFVGLLALEDFDVGPAAFLCPVPGQDSNYAPSHFSWIPPGEVCDFPSGDLGPTYWRIPAALALVAIPAAPFWVLPRKQRPSPTPGVHSAAS